MLQGLWQKPFTQALSNGQLLCVRHPTVEKKYILIFLNQIKLNCLPIHFCFKQILSKPQSSSILHSGGISKEKSCKIFFWLINYLIFTFTFYVWVTSETTWTVANWNMICWSTWSTSTASTTYSTWIYTSSSTTSFVRWAISWCSASS